MRPSTPSTASFHPSAPTASPIREEDNRGSRRGGRVQKSAEPIDYEQAQIFKELFSNRAVVTVSMQAASSVAVKHEREETNPTMRVLGVDEDYFRVKSYNLEAGRTFSSQEARRGGNIAVVGQELVKRLFKSRSERALGSTIGVGPLRLQIVGIIESKGQSENSADKLVIIPLATARNAYGSSRTRFEIVAQLPAVGSLDAAKSEATGAMRVARRLGARDANDFQIVTSDSLVEEIRSNTAMLQAGAIAIGLMTLFGAAIGLMNIMLVSVTERTREIGIIKALGASRSSILAQFLTEAVVITQLGGIVGIIIGMLVGNVVTLFAGGEFLVPWGWIAISFVVCLITGLLSGLYPAIKAARLDPIESLRYE